MKYLYNKLSVLAILSLLFPLGLNAQKGPDKDHIDIVVSCTEYIGDGKLKAHFGYVNTGKKTVVVEESGSVLIYNHGQAKKYGLTSFEPGVKEKVFSMEFEATDQVQWIVTLPSGQVKVVDADITSDYCEEPPASLDIIPGYAPPEGGKQYKSKIGAELTSLYNAYSADPVGFAGATDDIFQLDGAKVLIEVVAVGQRYSVMMDSLIALGFETVTENQKSKQATGLIDIEVLFQLNELEDLFYARPVYPGVSNYIVPATGLTKSQGDFAMHSDFARLGYDLDGSGVKIGVLSNSYNTQSTAHIDVGNGDLPGIGNPNGYSLEVDVIKDYVSSSGALSDEGRAMLQIVHDIAPGAELAFRTGFLGEQDMAVGIRELSNALCDVIVDDISYITEPFFRDGIISKTIDSVVNEGITFFSSAGNFGEYAYAADFLGTTAPLSISGEVHDFSGAGDAFQSVLLSEGSYTLVLQWDDGSDPDMATTQTDLDLFLSDDVGFSLLGFNRENIGGFPIEVVPFSVAGDSVYANVVISRAAGTLPVKFKYILFRGGANFKMLEYGDQGKSTIVGHPNAEKAISVGAVRFDKNPVYSPGEYEQPVIMSFSSRGGTPVDGIIRAKPDITAPNGVNTTIDLGNGDWVDPVDPDSIFPNFFGTSAASPHAAGVAALLIQGKLKFDSENPLDPEGIRSLMKSTALDMGDPGEDHVSGAGFIQAHKALMTFANPTPYIENLILASESAEPGDSIRPFSFTVRGDFFTDSTQILFRGEALDEGVVVEDENTITVEHPGFIGNPEIQAYTPEISPSELDGGTSEEIYFSDPVKQKVIIVADNTSKMYGEVMPVYTAEIILVTLDGDTLGLDQAVSSGDVLQAEANRLSALEYAVPASDTSGAGNYLIVPSLSPAYDPELPASEVDYALSEKYILEYVNGSLSIEKLPLTITPDDVEITYGEQLPPEGIGFSYVIGDSTVVIDDIGLILNEVEQEHTSALTNEISLIRGVAVVNGIPLIRGVAVVNGVSLVRGVAVVNGIEVKVEVAGSDTTVYVAGEPLVNGATLIRGIAVVNGLPFVNMTEIIRGVAVVNGDEVTFDDGYMTELNGVAMVNKVPVTSGVAMVNGAGFSRGVAIVNGHEVVIDEEGNTTIDGVPVPIEGIAQVNGIPVIRGVAVVNSSLIQRGVAVVNGLEIPIENGLPSVRGVAVVNGIPIYRGVAVVNNLEVEVIDGEVSQVKENGAVINVINPRGVAVVNGVAMVNGTQLQRGLAVVNGIAVVNDAGTGNDVVNLENMNFLASGVAIANGSVPSLRGVAVVNGIEGIDAAALSIAAGTVQDDSTVIYEEVALANGIAVVNGLSYVRGVAVVNGEILTNGNAVVNGSNVSNSSNQGTIMVFDATDVGAPAEDVSFTPMSFITGTSAGKHWIVPGTYLSNNYEISYGLGTLTVDPAVLSITADDQAKVYGNDDPELTYNSGGLLSGDTIVGALIREEGEDVGSYAILQGSLTAGLDYEVRYDSAVLSIAAAQLLIEVSAENKVYDGNREAIIEISENSLPEDTLSISYSSASFQDKNVGANKEVTVLGLSVEGEKAGNYAANASAVDSADISPRDLLIGLLAYDTIYYGGTDANTSAFIIEGLVEGDDVSVSSSGGLFASGDVGNDIEVIANVSASGADAGNYLTNETATDSADITPRSVTVIPDDPFLYMNEGDPLPVFAFNYLGWIPGDNVDEAFTVLRIPDEAPYDPSSSESAGTYTVTPEPYNSNYIFTKETGTLHVNPYGPGTRAVKPILNCIREIDTDYFMANFEYKNENDAAVYVPAGEDNLLVGSGIDWANSDPVPTMFAPGGGSFVVFFDGSDLSWVVNSRDGDQKVRNAANANSSSTKCKGNYKSASVSTDLEDDEHLDPDQLLAYPNPVVDWVTVTMKDIEAYKMITLFDLAGRSYPLSSIQKRANNIDIDMSEMPSGQYLIRIVMEESASVVQVIKQ